MCMWMSMSMYAVIIVRMYFDKESAKLKPKRKYIVYTKRSCIVFAGDKVLAQQTLVSKTKSSPRATDGWMDSFDFRCQIKSYPRMEWNVKMLKTVRMACSSHYYDFYT